MGEQRVVVGMITMNNEATIRETLDGLARQTVSPDALLVVDASDDATPEIIEEFGDEVDFTVSVAEQREGYAGCGGARQQLYEQFDGDILACLDTAHRPREDWIERRVEFHEENPEYGVLSGVDDEEVAEEVTDPHDRRFLILKNCSLTAEALAAVNGWDARMVRGEDWDMAIRLWRAGVRSYASGDLAVDYLDEDTVTGRLWKRRRRPSSIRFLRKYGTWYAGFHPVHVAGDAVSAVGLVCAGLLPAGLAIGGVYGLAVLLPAIAGALAYALFKAHVSVGGFDPLGHLDLLPEFFLLGYTALREVAVGPRDGWNMAGVDGEN